MRQELNLWFSSCARAVEAPDSVVQTFINAVAATVRIETGLTIDARAFALNNRSAVSVFDDAYSG